MTEQEQFEACDALEGNTMIVFSDRGIADRYNIHRADQGHYGLIAMAVDTRTKTGLCVMWRDSIPPEKLLERHGNCLWLLEETLAGRAPWPQPGEVGPVTKYDGGGHHDDRK